MCGTSSVTCRQRLQELAQQQKELPRLEGLVTALAPGDAPTRASLDSHPLPEEASSIFEQVAAGLPAVPESITETSPLAMPYAAGVDNEQRAEKVRARPPPLKRLQPSPKLPHSPCAKHLCRFLCSVSGFTILPKPDTEHRILQRCLAQSLWGSFGDAAQYERTHTHTQCVLLQVSLPACLSSCCRTCQACRQS